MAFRILPSQAYLRECLDYDPETGVLRWRARPAHHFKAVRDQTAWNNKMAGLAAGLRGDGSNRDQLAINGQIHSVHRVIWKWMTGDEPPSKIDHENRNPLDNRWDNLRTASNVQNSRNSTVRRTSRTGLKGVWTDRGYFHSYISVEGRRIYLGTFPTPELAHAAYCEAARIHFDEFWSDGKAAARHKTTPPSDGARAPDSAPRRP